MCDALSAATKSVNTTTVMIQEGWERANLKKKLSYQSMDFKIVNQPKPFSKPSGDSIFDLLTKWSKQYYKALIPSKVMFRNPLIKVYKDSKDVVETLLSGRLDAIFGTVSAAASFAEESEARSYIC